MGNQYDELEHELEEEGYGDPFETKAEKFKRLANFRLRIACKRIRMFKPLASSNYEYTADQAAFVIAALRNEVDSLEAAFKNDREDDEFPEL